MAKAAWSRDWTVGVRVWVDRHGETVLGEGRAELLAAIGELRSITAAAKAVGISYRKAWTLVQAVNDAAGHPLIESAVGGLQGGGARLTERGRYAVDVYRRLDQALTERAGQVLSQLVGHEPAIDAARCVHVAAAISFQEALGQILAAFALHRPTIRVRSVFGASNELAALLASGAPGDLFISAEAEEVDQLATAGRLVPKSRRTVALNGLAVIGPRDAAPIRSIRDLADAAVERIALAEPACPLGRYSKRYLETVGVYDRLLPKALYVDNSRAVSSAVASGAANVGLAFASDVVYARECDVLFRAPRSKAAVQYVAATLAGREQQAAGQLLEFFSSPAAVRCLRRCGLRPPSARLTSRTGGRSSA